MLGEGTYGQVYKIFRKIDGQAFAAKFFKILPIHMNSVESNNYKRELKILKLSNHPFII